MQARTSFEAAYRPPLGLKLKKSPSALEFFRRALAEQQLGQQQALQTGACRAHRASVCLKRSQPPTEPLPAGQGQSATQPPQQQPQQQPKSSSASGQASSLVLPLSMLTLSLERPSEDSDDEQRSITFSQMMAESCDDASGSCSPMHSVMVRATSGSTRLRN